MRNIVVLVSFSSVQNFNEVGERIEFIKLTLADQALDDSDSLLTKFSTAVKPLFSLIVMLQRRKNLLCLANPL